MLDVVKSWDRPTIKKSASDAGAIFVAPPGPWNSLIRADGRFVTNELTLNSRIVGVNPASAHAAAEAVVEASDDLLKNEL